MKLRNALIFLPVLLMLTACAPGVDVGKPADPTPTITVTPSAEPSPSEPPQPSAAPADSNGWNLFETVFLPIATGEIGRSLDDVTALLTQNGYSYQNAEGMLSVDDPEHAGSWLSSTLTNENTVVELSDLVYYLESDNGKRTIKIEDLRGDAPKYFIGESYLDEPVQVQSLDKAKDYIYGLCSLPKAPSMEILFREQIMTDFTGAIGEKTSLQLQLTNIDSSKAVEWTSSDKTVCTVVGDAGGCVITVKGTGAARVTAECDGTKASVIVRGIQSW